MRRIRQHTDDHAVSEDELTVSWRLERDHHLVVLSAAPIRVVDNHVDENEDIHDDDVTLGGIHQSSASALECPIV